jgi:hypothetical protein
LIKELQVDWEETKYDSSDTLMTKLWRGPIEFLQVVEEMTEDLMDDSLNLVARAAKGQRIVKTLKRRRL